MLLLCAYLLTLIIVLYCYFTRTFSYWKRQNIVGPIPVPFFGNYKEVALRQKQTNMVVHEIYKQFPNERFVGIYRMTSPALLIRDLDIIKNIMIKDFDVFDVRVVEFSKEALGENLFHADSDTWRLLRYRLSPIYTTNKLKYAVPLIVECGDKMLNNIESLCLKGMEHDIFEIIQKFMVASITASAFGLILDTYNNMDIVSILDKGIFTTGYMVELDLMYPGILRKLNLSMFPKLAEKFCAQLVKAAEIQKSGKLSESYNLIDLLIELKHQKIIRDTKKTKEDEILLEITESVITAQAFIFYAAGYITSATTTSFLFYQLALTSTIQDKVIAEIDKILQKYNEQVTYDAIMEMVYLDQVFQETLRMYPVVGPLQRKAQTDYNIPNTNVTIKKGQIVIISVPGIHFDEKYYTNPTTFEPERFAPENGKNRHPYAFMPFGIGPRKCIGLRLAKIQSLICIVKILSKYRVEPSKNTPTSIDFIPNRTILSPKGGIHLNFVPRR